jgi:hypothetical protein
LFRSLPFAYEVPWRNAYCTRSTDAVTLSACSVGWWLMAGAGFSERRVLLAGLVAGLF